MEYKKDYFGFVYEWTNTNNGKKYIGSHYGSVNDCYTGSGKDFMKEYKQSPDVFVREILEYVKENDKKILLKVEKKWLDSIPDIKSHSGYYNLNNDAVGGFGYINNDHIVKRANTLKQKHLESGLSIREQQSYKQKIKSRLDRIATNGFTDKEKQQHAKYGYQVSITDSSGTTTVYDSCGQASRVLGIDVQYGLKVCSTKHIDFKGYKIVKLRDPIVDCR